MRLKNRIVQIARKDAKLPKGGFFIADLIGASVMEENGRELGKITEVLDLPAGNVYVVRGEREHMIPAVPEFICEYDIDKGVVTVRSSRECNIIPGGIPYPLDTGRRGAPSPIPPVRAPGARVVAFFREVNFFSRGYPIPPGYRRRGAPSRHPRCAPPARGPRVIPGSEFFLQGVSHTPWIRGGAVRRPDTPGARPRRAGRGVIPGSEFPE